MDELRYYQKTGVEEIRASFRRGNRSVCYVGATGSGKTRMFTYVTAGAAAKGKRVCILEHRVELVEQACNTFAEQGLLYDTIQAGRKTVSRAQVNIASVQTLARRLDHYRNAFDLIVIDECHHAISTQNKSVLDANPKAHVLGVTATPERLDGTGLGEVFDDMVVGPSVRELIEQGYLADYRLFRDPNPPDFSKIRRVAGEYHAGDLEAFMASPKLIGDAIEHYRREADGLPSVLFCSSVAAAEMMAEKFRDAGYSAASVDGTMARDERSKRISGLKNGLQVLTSCMLINEGLDVPGIQAAILYRPTMSLGLYRQQIGRALRPKPDGSRAIILDHAGNSHKHGLPCIEIEWSLDSKKRKEGAGSGAPTRTCPECFMVQPITNTICENAECGFEFDQKKGPDVVDGTLEEVDKDKFRGVERKRHSIDAAIAECRSWKELEQLRTQLGFKRGWSHHVARNLGWREVTNRAGYTMRFEPLGLAA